MRNTHRQIVFLACLYYADLISCCMRAQYEALSAFSNGHDTVCLLPTSYGKSSIYQLTPYLKASLSSEELGKYITLVISRLNSIMRDQVNSSSVYTYKVKLLAESP